MKTTCLLAVLALPALCHASDSYRTDAHAYHNEDGEVTLSSQLIRPTSPATPPRKTAFHARESLLTRTPTSQDITASPNVRDKTTTSTSVKTTPLSRAPTPTTFFVSANEAPFRAITRWFEKKGYRKIAYSLSTDEQAALLTPMEENLNFTGDIAQSIGELGQKIGLPLKFEYQNGIAAVHTQNGIVEVHWIHGQSLKAVVKNLAHDYRWHWQDEGPRASWMSEDDYPLLSEYGIVTPRDGFDAALDTVLDDYPVQAQLIPSSRTLFIRKRQ